MLRILAQLQTFRTANNLRLLDSSLTMKKQESKSKTSALTSRFHSTWVNFLKHSLQSIDQA